MIVEQITFDGCVRIPEPVLEALGLKLGDTIAFDVEDGRVRLHRADQLDPELDQLFGDEADDHTDDEVAAFVEEALSDSRPTLSIDETFAEVQAHIEERRR